MIRINVELPDGTKSELVHADGLTYKAKMLDIIPNGDLKSHINDVRNLEIRDDDIYLATFPKSGTHWVWEILVMLRRGNAEYETNTKEAAFLDYRSPKIVDQIPSPRVLNCHYPCKLTPKGIFEKKIKIVHVLRNPKDVFVSFYHHHQGISKSDGSSKIAFDTFLPEMLGKHGYYRFYPWFQYVKEWTRFTKQHPGQIINIFYEDLKEDPIREIKKINKFLGTDRSDGLIAEIADACEFENLKKADADIKVKPKMMQERAKHLQMYRKGQVGDWKNHFTVKQNEEMDVWLEESLERSDEFISQIAGACAFDNLKKANANIKVQQGAVKESEREKATPMYRKGQVLDWKIHFTVAQNAMMDKWLEENLVDTELKFRYNL